ncbi:MAG TPA: hypothetical protein VKA46_15645 [Gemmataceae bacterium]|nr:hypothetical protein [Gemmataceae bacterium]
MPRKRRGFEEPPRRTVGHLAERLVDELKSDRQSGQPMIEEEEFPTKKLRVNVIWDEWERVPLEDRTATILRAYEQAEGGDYRDRIALASGLTIPEAHAAGMLPYQVIAAVRQTDPVTAEQCRRALIEEGASILFGEDQPQLRFSTEEDADAARKRLAERLPNSEPVWVVTKEVGTVEDWAQR